jgi:hypothetical protein
LEVIGVYFVSLLFALLSVLSTANSAKDTIVVASQDHEARESFSRQPKNWKYYEKPAKRLDESRRIRGISNSQSMNAVTKKAKEDKFKRAESDCEVCGWARRIKVLQIVI